MITLSDLTKISWEIQQDPTKKVSAFQLVSTIVWVIIRFGAKCCRTIVYVQIVDSFFHVTHICIILVKLLLGLLALYTEKETNVTIRRLLKFIGSKSKLRTPKFGRQNCTFLIWYQIKKCEIFRDRSVFLLTEVTF